MIKCRKIPHLWYSATSRLSVRRHCSLHLYTISFWASCLNGISFIKYCRWCNFGRIWMLKFIEDVICFYSLNLLSKLGCLSVKTSLVSDSQYFLEHSVYRRLLGRWICFWAVDDFKLAIAEEKKWTWFHSIKSFSGFSELSIREKIAQKPGFLCFSLGSLSLANG